MRLPPQTSTAAGLGEIFRIALIPEPVSLTVLLPAALVLRRRHFQEE